MTFYKKIPLSHELYHVMSDPQNGLKYAILKPVAGGNFKPWILTVAGTQTLLDKIVDGTMGRQQLERLTNLFSKCLFQNEKGQPLFDIPLVFVGHSLGGGLTQGLYHQIQGRLNTLRTKGYISPLSMVTFNAFGGKELLEQINVPLNPNYVQNERISNYFVRGDIVSKVGTHIGPTYEMLPVDNTNHEVKLDIAHAHALDTIYNIVRTSAALHLQMPTTVVAPPRSFTINSFYNSQKDKALGFALFLLPKVSYLVRSSNGSIAEFIEQTAALAAQTDTKTPEYTALFKYIQTLAADEEFRLRKRFSPTGASKRHADHLKQSVDSSMTQFNSRSGRLLKWLEERQR